MSSRSAVRTDPSTQPTDARLRIAIVGRGPAGMATAIALLRRVRRPFHLWMIDAADHSACFGNGPAGQALMSERAGQLSVLADRPLDFVDWLRGNLGATPGAGRGSVSALRGFENVYVPRGVFRDYLTMRFGEAFASRRDVTVQIVCASVVNIRLGVANPGAAPGNRLALALDDGSEMRFDQVFLATGHGRDRGEASSWLAAERLLWGRKRTDGPIVLAGDGPRMAAILLHLRTSGYAGEIRILSEHGRIPEPHALAGGAPLTPAMSAATGLAEALRHLRADFVRGVESVGGWQAVADGLNGQWSAFWRALPTEQQRRYWRHLRRLHRACSERIAPELHGRLARELRNPSTELIDARIIARTGDGILIRRKASREDEIVRGRLIDCSEEPAVPADGLLGEHGPGSAGRARDGSGSGRVEEDGRLVRFGVPACGVHVLGRAAGDLRPDIRLFADTVRQIYRATTGLDAGHQEVSARSGA